MMLRSVVVTHNVVFLLDDGCETPRGFSVDRYTALRRVASVAGRNTSVKSWRMQVCNSRKSWFLRRLVLDHRTRRDANQYCALCAQNVDGAIRTKECAHFVLFHVPLCTIKREGEEEHSCFQVRHNTAELKRRVEKTKSGPSTEEDRAEEALEAPLHPR